MLTVVDEYSRFPFAFPTKNLSSNSVIECLHSLFSVFGAPAYVHSDRGQSFMSHDIQQYFRGNGIATSRTTPYHPTGNGQVERYNGIIWKTILLALKSHDLDVKDWEMVLPTALHSIRSLLSTATNATPHERFLKHSRRSMFGSSLPSWLANGHTKVLLKRHVRSSKYEPLVDEVELLEANHQYAHIRFSDGRESTVSTQHLAPSGESEGAIQSLPEHTVSDNATSNAEHDNTIHIGPNHTQSDSRPDNTTHTAVNQLPAPNALSTTTENAAESHSSEATPL